MTTGPKLNKLFVKWPSNFLSLSPTLDRIVPLVVLISFSGLLFTITPSWYPSQAASLHHVSDNAKEPRELLAALPPPRVTPTLLAFYYF